MNQGPYIVTIILDRNYGERLTELPSGQPIWIVDTLSNRVAAEKVWAQHPNADYLTGVTTFKSGDDQSAEDMLLGEFDTIDLHHGWYSAALPYTVVNVIGVELNEIIETTLSEYGFNEFQSTVAGFRAVRPPPADDR